IGDEAQDALHRGDGAGIERVRSAALSSGTVDAVVWMGPCSDADLAEAYQGADLHVFPVRAIPGDVEGFGMVAIEAAAHGLSTVAFDVGGVADAVVTGSNGHLISYGDYVAFTGAVLERLADGRDNAAQRTRSFAQRFSWDRFGREVLDALAPTV